MDHRNQMKKELSSKEFLLHNSLVENEKPAIYSLEAEFAKTKRNRDLKPLLIVLGFVALLIGITFGTVRYLEHQSKQINIDISDFEDLRLKEALNQAKVREEELQGAHANLEGYQYALQALLKEKNAAGCVIDPRHHQKVLLFINKIVTSEMVVDLYRANNIYVGKIKLIPDANGVYAKSVEVAKGEKIKPLDWFRLPDTLNK